MFTRKFWIGFGLWEALSFLIAKLIVDNFSLQGGGFNSGPFIGAIVGMPLLWWSAAFAASAAIDYAKR
ncbi:MAG: hypothetical protein ACE5MI_12355 [Acidimicrobiia bacterium]